MEFELSLMMNYRKYYERKKRIKQTDSKKGLQLLSDALA